MSASFRPLLGAKVDDLEALRYPLYGSPKLDGIRAIWYVRELITRTLKTVPSRGLQREFVSLGIPSGTDGELIVGEPYAPDVFRKTTSAVMTKGGTGEGACFYTFDNYEVPGPFWRRLETLRDYPPYVFVVPHIILNTPEQATVYEEENLRKGYEGIILRLPEGPYKYGRSTLREQYLLKVKRFHDFEATIVGFEERLHNANEAERDERGYVKRSSHQDNLIPTGSLGAFVLRLDSGVEFNCGTGFTDGERHQYWNIRDRLIGQVVKVKSLPIGVKDKPRHPVFLGLRSKLDI